MPTTLTDEQIRALIQEPKRLPEDYERRLKFKEKRGHKESELEIAGDKGSRFQIRVRQLVENPLDFSVILGYHIPETNVLFRLRRYNGSHIHSNPGEKSRFLGYHIHKATERCQSCGLKVEDKFAEPSDRYSDLDGAMNCLLNDCGFIFPPNQQPKLL